MNARCRVTWSQIGTVALAAALCPLALSATSTAQELEPKAYSASPVGAAFLVAGLTRSSGAVVVDTSLPLSDVEAKINAGLIAAGYTFGFVGSWRSSRRRFRTRGAT